MFFYVMFDKA